MIELIFSATYFNIWQQNLLNYKTHSHKISHTCSNGGWKIKHNHFFLFILQLLCVAWFQLNSTWDPFFFEFSVREVLARYIVWITKIGIKKIYDWLNSILRAYIFIAVAFTMFFYFGFLSWTSKRGWSKTDVYYIIHDGNGAIMYPVKKRSYD